MYLLPCSCGRKIPVEPRQAGESVGCACGETVAVPTLLALSRLEMAPSPDEKPAAAPWGLPQRMVLFGAVLLPVAAIAAGLLYRSRPTPPAQNVNLESVQQRVRGLSAVRSMQFWYALQHEGLSPGLTPQEQAYEEASARWRSWLIVVAILGMAAIALIVGGAALAVQRHHVRGGGSMPKSRIVNRLDSG
jgi:hypothetical protein